MSNVGSGRFKTYTTPFHLVDPSPWPILTAFSVFQLPISLLLYWDSNSAIYFVVTLLIFVSILVLWMNDIIVEGTFQGMHTLDVTFNLRWGFALFIISEIMLFATFFGSYIYYALEASIWVGNAWPSKNINLIQSIAVPLLNSIILFTSSIFITLAHSELTVEDNEPGVDAFKPRNYNFIFFMTFLTIIFGLIFILCQFWEYKNAQFSIQDTVFGSLFYLITGFHGLHVIFGIIFLTATIVRLRNYHFTVEHHLNFEFAAFYWHFVDTIWFFVYLILYYSVEQQWFSSLN